MKRSILFLVCLMGMTFAFAQTQLQDVVYLKNGSIVRGDIIEMVPDETVKIQTFDGSVFVFSYADVEKFTKEEGTVSVPRTALDKKSPWAAGLMSYFVPGMGQLYNGESRKGWIDFATQVGAYAGTMAGMFLALDNIPMDAIPETGPDGELYYPGHEDDSDFLAGLGLTLACVGTITIYVNWIHSICDAVKSAKRINAENGFVMYQFNDRCAFGMQPSIAYERPRYMQGSSPELSAGMKFKLTF